MAAASAYKVVILYNLEGQGWSETWYLNQVLTPFPPVGPGGAPAIPGVISTFLKARNALNSPAVYWIGLKLYALDATYQPTRVTWLYTNNAEGSTDASLDYPTCSWLATVRGGAGVGFRQCWLRGIPESYFAWDPDSGQFLPAGNVRNTFANFLQQLTAGPWCIRTINSNKAGGLTPVPALISNAANGAVILSASPPGAGPGAAIIVGGFKYPLQHLNGNYVYPTGYSLFTAGSVQLNQRAVTEQQIAAYNQTGTLRVRTYSLTPIAACALEFVRSRRVGRAFFVPRGRRSAK